MPLISEHFLRPSLLSTISNIHFKGRKDKIYGRVREWIRTEAANQKMNKCSDSEQKYPP